MPKPKIFPETLELRLPEGTKARIDRVIGVDPQKVRSGQTVRGDAIRLWILERLESEENKGVTVSLDMKKG
jgi:hypothetical protein